ncbi:hypothetical protein WISP_134579 [Willisornis vidua]|uniref:Uncharacterized protein n=1 Tax=Willisornis vidua TaxID=1566151 RepID=A0ABQ9CTN6_9PASS|nr:hypothetical protein WISP_134579 [Willisornis vidua]
MLAECQGSSLPSSGAMHHNEDGIRQKCRKSPWMAKELLSKLRAKKRSFQKMKMRTIVWVARDKVMEAKPKPELSQARDIKGNRDAIQRDLERLEREFTANLM